MTRAELENYIDETYPAFKDYPWMTYPNFAVFRHKDKAKKGFAFVMDISKTKLGLRDDSVISVVNLKCDPIMVGSFLRIDGIYPAYHMNKEHWLTVALDGRVSDDEIKMLLDMSFEITAPKIKK